MFKWGNPSIPDFSYKLRSASKCWLVICCHFLRNTWHSLEMSSCKNNINDHQGQTAKPCMFLVFLNTSHFLALVFLSTASCVLCFKQWSRNKRWHLFCPVHWLLSVETPQNRWEKLLYMDNLINKYRWGGRERDPWDAFLSIQYLLYHSQLIFWCRKYADHMCLMKSSGYCRVGGSVNRDARGTVLGHAVVMVFLHRYFEHAAESRI